MKPKVKRESIRKIRKAFTLVELLVVVLIVLIVLSIILPVFVSSKREANAVVCSSNLRQIYIAWASYIQDYGGTVQDTRYWPTEREIHPYVKDNRVWICPLDPHGGSFKLIDEFPTSYYLQFRHSGMPALLVQHDTNPGIGGCVLHGKCVFSGVPIPICWGKALRLRLDGSVVRIQYPAICRNGSTDPPYGSCFWYLLTDAPPPPGYCFGNPCYPP